MAYDTQNIFAKILRGEIPAQKVFENEVCLAFHDIQPKAPTRVLIIPKSEHTDWMDFTQNADPGFVSLFFKCVSEVVTLLNLPENGFRLITNSGLHGGQEVPHFHIHILGGAKLPGF